MTPDRSSFEALIQQWRDRAGFFREGAAGGEDEPRWCESAALRYDECADQLDALIAAIPQAQMETNGKSSEKAGHARGAEILAQFGENRSAGASDAAMDARRAVNSHSEVAAPLPSRSPAVDIEVIQALIGYVDTSPEVYADSELARHVSAARESLARLRAAIPQQEKENVMHSKTGLYRCKVCGTRWLLWPDVIHGGGWNLLDREQRPGSCCDNTAMGEQIEHLRDLPLDPQREQDIDVQLLAWAVSNCHMLARRELNRLRPYAVPDTLAIERWEHVLRICEKAGARSKGVLRASVPTEITDGSGDETSRSWFVGNEQAWEDLRGDGGLPESQAAALPVDGREPPQEERK